MKKQIIIASIVLLNISKVNANTLELLDFTNKTVEISQLEKTQNEQILKYQVQNNIISITEDIKDNIEKNKEKKEIFVSNDIVIPDHKEFLYIRKEPNIDSEIIAKLYEESAASIIKYINNNWFEVKSGDIIGYIENKDILQGENTKKYIEANIMSYQKQIYSSQIKPIGIYKNKKDINKKIKYKVTSKTKEETYLYQLPSENSIILDKIFKNTEIKLVNINNDWIEIKYKNQIGYINKKDIDINYKIISNSIIDFIMPTKKYKIENYNKNYATIKIKDQLGYIPIENLHITVAFDNAEKYIPQDIPKDYDIGGIPKGKAKKIIEYSFKFLGNPYVWGGESLTKGCDCSGFTMLIMRHFAINLPHYSKSQAKCGKEIKIKNTKPGDLIFYGNNKGEINHVGIYIGQNKIINASNPRTGIKISQWNYRTPIQVRRVIS